MSDPAAESGSSRPRLAARAGGAVNDAWRVLPAWRRLAAVFSVIVMVLGGGTAVATGMFGGSDARPASPTSGGDVDGASDGSATEGLPGGLGGPLNLIGTPDGDDASSGGLPPEGTGGGDGAGDDLVDRYSPAVFRAGFSFFVGFAVAFAVRSFVKISIAAIGFMALALFGLQYAGLVDVQWDMIASRWDDLGAWLRPQIESFQALITGALPSATAATAGLFTGFKKG